MKYPLIALAAYLFFLSIISATCTARTWYIKPDGTGDVPTIQAGIDSTAPADTVLLADGIYTGEGNRDVDFGPYSEMHSWITVKSESGDPGQCIVDCQGTPSEPHRGFLAAGGGTGSTLEGITIRGGYLNYDGGIGGGVSWGSGWGMIVNCIFSGNHNSHNGGGLGVTTGGLETHVVGCSFINNYSDSRGGGVHFEGYGGLAGCDFVGNWSHQGGALSSMGGPDSILDCTFSADTASYNGGAISFESAGPVIERCTFSNNISGAYGGALYFDSCRMKIGHSIFISNTSVGGDAGALYCRRCPLGGDSALVSQCSFWGNSSGYGGGDIKSIESSLVLRGLILACSQDGVPVECDGNLPQLECCDIYGNAGGDWVGCIADQYGIDGNFSLDPRFCDASGGDFYLAGDSPCLRGLCGTVGALGKGCFGAGPCIAGTADVGGDQGRQIRLRWERSKFDAPGDTVSIVGYEVYRRQDEYLARVGWTVEEQIWSSGPEVVGASSAPMLVGWDYVGTIPAHGESLYQYVAPTLCDSTDQGICWSVFLVRAATDDPFEYYDSYADSGYSVDNLAPAPPSNLRMTSPIALEWDESSERDFQYFTVYGSVTPGLDSTAAIIGYTVATTMDVGGDVCGYYHVTATDVAGNEGAASSIQNAYAGVRTSVGIPTAFALRPNQPNPFSLETSIAFDLPVDAVVSLKVYDPQGRLVRALADRSYAAGYHVTAWAGDDEAGQTVASGIYFVRIEAGEFKAASKMLLMK